MELLVSRRLTGPNLLLDRAGAVLDVAAGPDEIAAVVETWRHQVCRLLAAVGWGGEQIAARTYNGGASLAISAPIDALYAATELNERAFEAAVAELQGAAAPDLAAIVHGLGAAIAREANPLLIALRDAALARGVTFLADDKAASIGLGTGCRTWPTAALPRPDAVDWSALHDVPVVLITGTNGKTTTVRLLATMLLAAGRIVGTTTSDRVTVGGEVVARGDLTGPGGARTVLRDRRVE